MILLIQLHQEEIETGDTNFCVQQEIRSARDMDKFLEVTKREYVLPDGYRWIACKEGSIRFLMQADKGRVDKNGNV